MGDYLPNRIRWFSRDSNPHPRKTLKRRLQMQLIQLLKSPVTVAVLAVFHDLMIVSLRRAKIFGSLGVWAL